MQRALSAFPIPSSQLSKLTEAGFCCVEDFVDVQPLELSKETGLGQEDALSLLRLVREDNKTTSAAPKTALQLLDLPQDCIVTFCQALDDVLGGGVPVGKVTEFCGAPGIGKTQMCIQLAVDVQVPSALGGLGGQAVYIDTEGSFMVDRVMDIASATREHCQQVSVENDNVPSVDGFLSGIHLVRCLDYVQLLAFVHLLPQFLSTHSEVKLIIIDSVAFPFRHGFDDLSLRTRILNGLSQTLIKIATQHHLAVVLTNQMTTRIAGSSSHLVPALGESWGHASTMRVILHWENTVRKAMLYKAPHAKEATVQYQITTGGIRDIASSTDSQEAPPAKRPRLEET